MAIHDVPIPETYLSITRRVARSAINRVMQYLDIPSRTQVKILGDAPQVLIWSSEVQSMMKLKHPEERTKFSQHGKIEVIPKEEPVENRIIANPLHKYDQAYVFHQPDINVTVYPIKTHMRLVLSCVYRAENREQYTRFQHHLQRLIASGYMEAFYEVQYNMLLSNFVTAGLLKAYDLSEPVLQTGLDFANWLHKYSSGHIKMAKQLDGKNIDFYVPETQTNVLGWIENTLPPEGNRTDQGPNYEVNFDIIIEYDKPEMWVLDYPLVICNEVVPEWFRPQERYSPSRVHALRSNSQYYWDMIHPTSNEPEGAMLNDYEAFRIPEFDDWKTKFGPPSSKTMIDSLILVDPEDKHQVINLLDFEEVIIFTENMKRYFDIFRPYLLELTESPLLFSVYVGDKAINSDEIYIDEHFNIRTENPLDLTKTYHVKMTFLLDWRLLSEAALKRLAQVPWITDDFLKFLLRDYDGRLGRYKGWLDRFIQDFYRKYGRYPTQKEIDDYFKSLHPSERENFFGNMNLDSLKDLIYNGNLRKGLMRTVGLYTVVAHHPNQTELMTRD